MDIAYDPFDNAPADVYGLYEQLRDDALIGIGAGDLFIQRGDIRDRQIAIDVMDCALDLSGDGAEVACVADFKVIQIAIALRGRQIVHHPRACILRQAA